MRLLLHATVSTATSIAATMVFHDWIAGVCAGLAYSVGAITSEKVGRKPAKEVTSINIIPGFLKGRPAQSIEQPDEEVAILPPRLDKPTADYGKRIDPEQF